MKTFPITWILFACLNGFVHQGSCLHERNSAVVVLNLSRDSQSSSNESESFLKVPRLHEPVSASPSAVILSLSKGDSDIDDDYDNDEPVQQRSIENVLVDNFRPSLFKTAGPQENFISAASHCILIHCLKI